ncbi:ATP-dependent RecD-like DNA helicase [Colwellia asteriadis]|uniref:ATP-dependent RecD-like DNA helicase n=1 Tax=Colwellia asteriadis TaxID=517723 RepID=A0ABN1L547_9GAMM
MKLANIKFNEEAITLVGVVTHIIHSTRDNRGISAIFQLMVKKSKIVVVAEFGSINSFPIVGEIWHVTGEYKTDLTYGSQFKVEKSVKSLPDKDTPLNVLADYLVFNSIFTGITRHWAKKLIRTFDSNLYNVLENSSVKSLTDNKKLKIPKTLAFNLLDSWRKISSESELNEYFIAHHFPIELVEATRQLLGTEASKLLDKNPYLIYPIMSVKALQRTWKELDSIIRSLYKISKNDPRRAVSFIESKLYSAQNDHGHMALPIDIIEAALKEAKINFDLTSLNEESAEFKTLCLNKSNKTVQILGHQAIEKSINVLLQKRIKTSEHNSTIDMFDVIPTYNTLESLGIHFNHLQKKALEIAFTHMISVIDGASFSGKRVIIQSLVDVLLRDGGNVWLISSSSNDEVTALSRLEGESIYRFISKAPKRNKIGALSDSLIIIENAHSIDTLTFYKLLKKLPLTARLCLVGDHRKLPPLGPGNVFSQLLAGESDAITRLEKCYNFRTNNKLFDLSSSFLSGTISKELNRTPTADLSVLQDICIYESQEKSHEMISNITANIWFEYKSNFDINAQIICTSNLLCELINKQIQLARLNRKKAAKVVVGNRMFFVGDPIIFSKQNTFLGVSSGALSTIHEVFDKSKIVHGRECLLSIVVDEQVIEISKEELECISLSYAITAHKVQNHHYENTMIVLDNFYLISKAWLYTVINATDENLLFIGNRNALSVKMNTSEFSLQRHFGIPITLAGEYD